MSVTRTSVLRRGHQGGAFSVSLSTIIFSAQKLPSPSCLTQGQPTQPVTRWT